MGEPTQLVSRYASRPFRNRPAVRAHWAASRLIDYRQHICDTGHGPIFFGREQHHGHRCRGADRKRRLRCRRRRLLRLLAWRAGQAGRARRPLRLPAPPCPHALRQADRRPAQVRARRAAGLRRRRRGARPRADQGRGRRRIGAQAGRQAGRRDRPGHPVQPVPRRPRVRPPSLPRHAAAARGDRPRRWPSSGATEGSISARQGSSATARRRCCCCPTSAS